MYWKGYGSGGYSLIYEALLQYLPENSEENHKNLLG
jgi:hypothetical protein